MSNETKVLPILDRMGRGVEMAIRRHEQLCPARCPRAEPGPGELAAVPFAQMRIPDDELAEMVEILETIEGMDLDALAERFDRPKSVVFRELSAYWRRYFRWVISGRRPRWAC